MAILYRVLAILSAIGLKEWQNYVEFGHSECNRVKRQI